MARGYNSIVFTSEDLSPYGIGFSGYVYKLAYPERVYCAYRYGGTWHIVKRDFWCNKDGVKDYLCSVVEANIKAPQNPFPTLRRKVYSDLALD